MTTPRRPPGRYDEPRALSRPALLTVAGVLGLALLALTFAAWQRFSPGETTVTLLGYRVVDDRTVELRFRVEKDPGRTVTCTAGAYDRDHQPVAAQVLTVGPARERAVVVVRRLGTTKRATTAFVADCAP